MILNAVKPLVYYFKPKTFHIFDPVFKIHSKLTVYFLLICSILVTGHIYTGKPIECITGKSELMKQSTVELICWVNGTFTLHDDPGSSHERYPKQIPHYQRYYQWILTILLLEAALFSIPELLWKTLEQGRMQQLCGDLDGIVLTVDCPEYDKAKERLINYLKMKNSRIHGSYVFKYVLCEVLNFLTVVLNMYILNVIFDRFWSRYLPAVISMLTSDGMSFSELASEIFPIRAKCTYTTTGSSGSTQYLDALCYLALNVINEKIFAFLYIWYVLLLFVSGCNLMWRSLILMSSCLRLKMIQSLTKWTEPLSKRELKNLLANDNIGDWFIIYLLGQNLNRFAFRDILNELAMGNEPLNNDI